MPMESQNDNMEHGEDKGRDTGRSRKDMEHSKKKESEAGESDQKDEDEMEPMEEEYD